MSIYSLIKHINKISLDLIEVESKIYGSGGISEYSPQHEYIAYNLKHAGHLISELLEEWGDEAHPNLEIIEVDCDES
jgi:hypothetical protein